MDSSNNIYVTGFTKSTNGIPDLYLVKYNSSGDNQWSKRINGTGNDYGLGVVVDSSNDIYVSGYADGVFDGNTHSGSNDIILVKYNSSGDKQWTKQLGTSESDIGRRVTVDSSNNIYVTGWTLGGLDGNTGSGSLDIILVKYNSSGTKQWTKQLGTSENDQGLGVMVDSSDNIYVTGQTAGGLDNNTNLGGDSDVFLVKYNSDGVLQ